MNSLSDQLHDTVEIVDGPSPLPSRLPDVDEFDPNLLPESIRFYAMDVVQRQQSPPEYCAVASLVALAGVVGRKVRISPKQNDDWTITPNLWGGVIGDPSTMKSPALKAMLFPLHEIEKQQSEAHKLVQAQYENEAEICEMERQAAKKRAKQKIENDDREGACAELAKIDVLEEPPKSPPRLIINDATVEALGERLNENPNGLTLVRDELPGWLAKMQQEQYAPDRAFYLECFNGEGRYTYDRIGRGTITIDNCMLSIIGGMQPTKLCSLVRGVTTGTDDDGLLQRFQLAVWPDRPTSWQWVDQAPAQEAKERYRQVFYKLHEMKFYNEGGESPIWHFSSPAQVEFISWMEELQASVRSGELPPVLESHLLKMPKTVCSLALLFALVDGEQGEVSHASTCRALAWADFLYSHMERVYSAVTYSQVSGAHLIHQRRAKLPHPFTVRDIHRKQWGGLSNIDDVREAIEVLIEHNHIHGISVSGETGRPTTYYYWHSTLAPKEES